jgi:hypothetical protein
MPPKPKRKKLSISDVAKNYKKHNKTTVKQDGYVSQYTIGTNPQMDAAVKARMGFATPGASYTGPALIKTTTNTYKPGKRAQTFGSQKKSGGRFIGTTKYK